MYGTRERESSTRGRVHKERGGAGGRMGSGSNELRSRHHGRENCDLCLIKGVLEHRHQRKKMDSRSREEQKMELRGGHPGEGRAPEVDLAVQKKNGK